jgi:hypothetical protein
MVRPRSNNAGKTKRAFKKIGPLYLTAIAAAIFLISASGAVLVSRAASKTNADPAQLAAELLYPCQDKDCVWNAAAQLTSRYGPDTALQALQIYKDSGRAVGDTHEWAHIVGRQTARTFGYTGQSFLKCPTTFNYGCMHGFFEEVLGHSGSTRDAVDQICGRLESDSNYSDKFKFYCYHGVGHGIMQSYDYDLKTALSLCDGLSTHMAQDGCWQGVFMENTNGDVSGKARPGVFLADDPLAPCDKVDAKYRYECYVNHAPHLMKVYAYRIKDASAACLGADGPNVQACLLSVGLMAANDTWLPSLKPATSGPVADRAWTLCKEFPPQQVGTCVQGVVDYFGQFDELNISRANEFCQTIDASLRQTCYERIGFTVKAQVLDDAAVKNKCGELQAADASACLAGAGV